MKSLFSCSTQSKPSSFEPSTDGVAEKGWVLTAFSSSVGE
jgi:hypothetical protein